MITAGILVVGDEVVMLGLLVEGVVDTVDAELEAELEVLEALDLESEEEEEAPVDDDDEEDEVEDGVEDVVVGVIGSGLIGVNNVIDAEVDVGVVLD